MPSVTTKNQINTNFDYREAAENALRGLKRDRDRQILSRRFGLGLSKRQTLESIGQSFGITRERVRQIEKAALGKIKNQPTQDVTSANQVLASALEQNGGVMPLNLLAAQLGAEDAASRSYIYFLATLAGDIEVIDEDDQLRPGLVLNSKLDKSQVKRLSRQLVDAIKKLGKPATIDQLVKETGVKTSRQMAEQVATLSKDAASLDGLWGLAAWPHVNPKSIRDKTYVVLKKHSQPLHFSHIADKIQDIGSGRRNVTVQAVHNELIKDPRFILIGRGIYALAEWGYTPGTVADIIIDVLRSEGPLHRDEIVRRVLEKRQVKTTTIILNLQEKKHFDRVAKATYKLKGQ